MALNCILPVDLPLFIPPGSMISYMHLALDYYSAKHSISQMDFLSAEPHHPQLEAIAKVLWLRCPTVLLRQPSCQWINNQHRPVVSIQKSEECAEYRCHLAKASYP